MKYFDVSRNPAEHPFYKNPEFVKEKHFAVINVSDTPCLTFDYMAAGVPSYWVPIQEVWHWGYSPFYVAAKVLDLKLSKKDERPILIHCHAGANRSASVAHAILISELPDDNAVEEIQKLDMDLLFNINISKNFIPSDIIEFLKVRKQYPSYSIMGLLQAIGSKNIYLRKENQPNLKFRGVEL